MIWILNSLKFSLCAVLCIVSMVLTALFALSFGSDSVPIENGILDGSSSIILITIGLVLDLSKYIFWGAADYSRTGNVYKGLAIVLMVFSWMASVAFFITNEEQKVTTQRKDTPQYQAFLSEIESLDLMIDQKSVQSKKRLGSKYHDQWDKSEELTSQVEKLVQRRQTLLNSEPSIGMDTVSENLVSMAFFTSVSRIVNMDSDVVRNVFYGMLALLVEVCAFGLIRLCRRPMVKMETPDHPAPHNMNDQETDYSRSLVDNPNTNKIRVAECDSDNKKTYSDAEIRLIRDIKSGEAPPVFNKLKEMDYGLSQVKIRRILKELKDDGILTEGSRRSLVLARPILKAVN